MRQLTAAFYFLENNNDLGIAERSVSN